MAANSDLSAIALLDEPVRRRLYEWVTEQGRSVGRAEAAQALNVSRALAAFHLDRLVEAGLLEAGYQRLTGRTGPGAGRPARVYSRAAREIAVSLPPRRYDALAGILATALERVSGPEPPSELVDAAAAAGRKLVLDHPPASNPVAPTTDPLLTLLESNGYEPVTAGDGTIRLHNCPFDALVDEHRQLVCGANLAYAQGIVDGLATAVAGGTDFEPTLDPQPGFCCVTFKPHPD